MSPDFKPEINPHIASLKESATLAINLKAQTARRNGEDIVHFGFGQSPFPVHPLIQIALARNACKKEYLPTKGLPELCQAISSYHKEFFGYDFDPQHVVVGPGSKEMIFQALYVLEGSVFLPVPSWVSYGPQVGLRGKDICPVITQLSNDYKMTPNELDLACIKEGPGQKILIFNNPSNPTGTVYSEREIRALTEVCRKHRVIVISDEIYSLISFSGQPYFSFHQCYKEGTIITSGLSKSHGAGGYRLGFIAFPPNMAVVVKGLAAMVSETFSAVSAPIQYAACEAYSKSFELMRHIKQSTRIHKACGKYLQSRFVKMGLNCPRPKGAFYLFPDFSPFKEELAARGILTSSQLCNTLFDEHRVATLPGSDFYCAEDVLSCRVATVDYDGEAVYSASLEPLLKVEFDEFHLDDAFVEEHCPRLKSGADRIEAFLQSL